jgi:hypothetical protein
MHPRRPNTKQPARLGPGSGSGRREGTAQGTQPGRGLPDELLVPLVVAPFEPGEGGFDQPTEEGLGAPGVEESVARVEPRELAHDVDRDGAQLRGVGGEPGLPGGMTPEQGESGRVLAGHREQGPWPQAAVGRFGQFAPQFLAQLLEDLLEDGPVEILFGPEVPVDDQLGHAAAGGHVVHGRLSKAGRREGTRRALEDGGASLGPR